MIESSTMATAVAAAPKAPVAPPASVATAPPHQHEPATAPDALVEQDLLVEDISIDGMCGVY